MILFKRLILLVLFLPYLCFAGDSYYQGVDGVVDVTPTTACVGYSNDDTSCSASLDAGSQLNLSGSTTTAGRKWVTSTAGDVSKITIGLNGVPSGGTWTAVFYIGTALTGYKNFTPSSGENEVDFSSGVTGTTAFGNGDTIYYGLSVNAVTAGGLERDEGTSQPPANYFFMSGNYIPDPVTWSENATREVAIRLEYTF